MRKPRTQKKPAINKPVRVTMMDIAAAAGCSQAAVSFVLNDTPGTRISQQTRDRVLEAARALGYMGTSYTMKASYSGLDNVIGFAVDQLATSPEAIVAIEAPGRPPGTRATCCWSPRRWVIPSWSPKQSER